jgi:Asp-tRNA(Asn)/Glu-tRNA(Gln) amidotransferase A subunit family amidase
VTDPESNKTAVCALGTNKKLLKQLEDARKSFVTPLNNHVKDINNLFKTLTCHLSANEDTLKREMGRYESAQAMERRRKEAQLREEQRRLQEQLDAEARAQREEAERKAQEAAEQLTTEEDEAARARLQQTIEEETEAAAQSVAPVIAPVVAEKPQMIRTSEGAAYTKMKWECRIINPDEVPRDCCEPSQKLLDARVKAGAREIPGCIIEEVPIIHVRV